MTALLFTGYAYAGNEVNVTPTLSSFSLESNATTVNKAETVQLSVMGTYSDNSTKAVDENVTYIITPSDSAEVNGSVLTALKDGNVTVQAKVGTILSNTINLNITWIVKGHTLPPAPDPQVNNATLLGVDVNNNGVRDDVERHIYKTYKQPIERGIFLQTSRAYNSLLTSPLVKHKGNMDMDNVTSCLFYWIYDAKPIPFDEYDFYEHGDELKTIQLNTVKRLVAKRKYELSLSGGVYSVLPISRDKCEFDENGTLKAEK